MSKLNFTMRRGGMKMATVRVALNLTEDEVVRLKEFVKIKNKEDKSYGLRADNTWRGELENAASNGLFRLMEEVDEKLEEVEAEKEE